MILDEAAMARTDDLAKLVRAVLEARAKLVLVGEPEQLGTVGPGGVFRTLVREHPGPELETVRRFSHAWEKPASLRLRAGDPSALSAYDAHGRITSGTREEMLDRAFTIWRAARDEGSSVLVMAGDNETTDELARRCQADRLGRGEIEAPSVPIATDAVGVGDEIVTLRNDRRIRSDRGGFVRNGDRFGVTARGADGSAVVSSLDGRLGFVLPAVYVEEHVALGYALTIHKAQGTTTDRAVVLVEEGMTRPQLYVGMTRGREENRVLVVSATDDVDHGTSQEKPAFEVLRSVLRHDGADRSAHDVVRSALAAYEDRTLSRTSPTKHAGGSTSTPVRIGAPRSPRSLAEPTSKPLRSGSARQRSRRGRWSKPVAKRPGSGTSSTPPAMASRRPVRLRASSMS